MPYVTVDQVRSYSVKLDAVPDADILRAMAWFESKFEGRVGVAFDLRERTVAVDGSGRRDQRLPNYPIRSVLAVSVDNGSTATDFTVEELADLLPLDTGYLRRQSLGYWPQGCSNIVVTYEHGFDSADFPEIADACLVETTDKLLQDVTNARADRRTYVAGEGTSRILEKGIFETRIANKVVEELRARFHVPAMA